MIEQQATIQNPLGLHARAAARFVTIASEYESEIHVRYGEKRVNGKSIMGLMMLAAAHQATLTIEAEGTDAEPALEALVRLVTEGFGETEHG